VPCLLGRGIAREWGQFIEPDTEHARLTADYVEQNKTGLGVEPLGCIGCRNSATTSASRPAGLVPEVEDYDLSH
jgi:hypothetical protein